MDDEDARQAGRTLARQRQVTAHLSISLQRIVFDRARRQPLVIPRNLLGLRESGIQRVEEHGRGHAADRESRRPLEKSTAIDQAMDVLVEQPQHFGIEIGCSLALHARTSVVGRGHYKKRSRACSRSIVVGLRQANGAVLTTTVIPSKLTSYRARLVVAGPAVTVPSRANIEP